MKFIISENQHKLFISENYDSTKEFLEYKGRVIVSIPNKNNPKDPNSCKVLRYATPEDQKLRLDPKNTTNYSKSEEYSTFCYTKGDLENKIKIFDNGLGKQSIDKENQVKKNVKQTEQSSYDLLRYFSTQMYQKISGSFLIRGTSPFCSTGEFTKEPDTFVNNTQLHFIPFKKIAELKDVNSKNSKDIDEFFGCYNQDIIGKSYEDYKKLMEENDLPLLGPTLGKHFGCIRSDSDCQKKIDYYLKFFNPKTYQEATTGEVLKQFAEDMWEHKHTILYTISLVASFLPGIAPAIALAADLYNAKLYHDEGNDYEAGLTLIFAVIPAKQLYSNFKISPIKSLPAKLQKIAELEKMGKLTDETLSKLLTYEEIRTLEQVGKNSQKILELTQKALNKKMMSKFVEKFRLQGTELENLIMWYKKFRYTKPVIHQILGDGIMIGGAWYTWDKLAEAKNLKIDDTKVDTTQIFQNLENLDEKSSKAAQEIISQFETTEPQNKTEKKDSKTKIQQKNSDDDGLDTLPMY